MKTKDYLLQYESAKRKIEAERENILKIVEAIDSMSIDYSGMPHGHDISSKQERYVLDLERALESKSKKICEWTSLMLEIEAVILTLEEPMYSRLLRMKYIEGLHWNVIALKLGYSEQHTKSVLHNKALGAVKIILDNTQ